ncbi:hypothetical protein [Halanaerobacter jeridensis]|uniref:Outer membrane protein beta-barrel domain-containing protein n=1 Tax=Halanaerobacter jeridensis TaxID=706427 RepID=A0A939BQ63_9FIRM|nr:hypothetical protein [Halanaerobacter jeridensis]MBM7555954.1 hypothetical protein [Halanaerobacter jeridensis]
MNKRIILVTMCLIILMSGTVAASTLSIGQGNYNVKFSNFSPRSAVSDITLVSVGYGQDQYSGFAADIFSGDNASGIEVEYQFIPQNLQERNKNFNYAAKIGAVTGDYWEEDSSGLKAGVVIERKIDREREVYFEADIINSSAMIIDAEVGFCGRFGQGIMGVLGYKIATHEDYETAEGVHYGIKIDF